MTQLVFRIMKQSKYGVNFSPKNSVSHLIDPVIIAEIKLNKSDMYVKCGK